MCGIAGYISKTGIQTNPSIAKSLSEKLQHRGPDDEGFVFFKNGISYACAGNQTAKEAIHFPAAYAPQNYCNEIAEYDFFLLHRRLSILDLSPLGHQPQCDSEKKIWITYNGEIYNYKALRADLESAGVKFYTESDTEVVIQSYKKWGTDFVNKLNGMWAFVIYDSNEKILFASRDRTGVKPFYFVNEKDYFAFASEPKAFMAIPEFKPKLNEKAVYNFLALTQMEMNGEGLWSNIHELLPGNNLFYSLTNKSYSIHTYYTFSLPQEYLPLKYYSFEKIIHDIKEKLKNAVIARMQSDVTVGSCLSGGLDSSVIVGIMRQHLKQTTNDNIHVFTASFPGSNIDEGHWAKLVSDFNHCQSYSVEPSSNELLNDLQDLIYCQDSPLWSTSTYAQFCVMKMVNEAGIKVVLDGQGGDELFAGYKPYQIYFWKELFRNSHFKSLFMELNASTGISGNIMYLTKEELKKRMNSGAGALLQKFYRNDSAFLNADFKKSNQKISREKFADLNENLLYDFAGGRLKTYLKCEDRCAMHWSVESRTPFADDLPLIEYLFQLPGELKINQGQLKYLLREAGKEFLPTEVYQRKDKIGYQTPNDFWLKQIANAAFANLNEKVFLYIDKNKFEKALNHLQKNSDHLKKFENGEETVILFKTLTLSVFFDVFHK